MNRSNIAQKRISILAVLAVAGSGVYLNALARSMRKDNAKMQNLDEQVFHSPQGEAFTEKIEMHRRLLQAIAQDDAPQVASSLRQGITGNTIVGTQSVCGFAASHGAVRVMSLLLSQGANINAQDRRGSTPLIEAVKNDTPALANFRLVNGAYIKAWNHSGSDPLQAANNKPSMVDFLLAQGADVNLADTNGATALCYAAERSQMAMVQTLIKHGARVNIQPHYGSSPTVSAAAQADINLLHLLLARGGDPNENVKPYGSLLRYARQFEKQKGHAEFIQALIQAGAKE